MDQFVVVPGPRGSRFVELSRSKQGRVFRKQILHYGPLKYPGVPGGQVMVDEEFADTLIANFAAGVADIVQVPKVGENNQHTEDPDRNIGEVIKVYKDNDGVFVDMDVRTDDAAKMGKTLLGASALMHLDYVDTHSGKRVGPTLLHTAITNRPYVTNLQGFEEVIAASGRGADIDNQVLVLTPADENEETGSMTLEEMIASLKADHGIDVAELQGKAATADASVALSNKIQEQLVGTGLLKLSNTSEPVDADTLIGAVAEAGNQIIELSGKVNSLVESAAKTEAVAKVEKLVLSGHILPKKQDAYVKLLLSDPEAFSEVVPDQPLIRLSVEDGQEPSDNSNADSAAAEVDRLAQVAANSGAHVRV